MTAAAPTDNRAALYQSLVWRNRIVSLLRLGVPVIGVCVFFYILLQIAIDTVTNQFGISNIRIDRDNLVVETPHLTATGDDGTLYALEAQSAKVAVGDPDKIDMQGAVFTMTPPARAATQVTAAAAAFQVHDQLLDIPGVAYVSSADGMKGTLNAVFADLISWNMVADGAVDVTMPDGSTLSADGMTYDGRAGLFTFTRVEMMLPQLPGAAP